MVTNDHHSFSVLRNVKLNKLKRSIFNYIPKLLKLIDYIFN